MAGVKTLQKWNAADMPWHAWVWTRVFAPHACLPHTLAALGTASCPNLLSVSPFNFFSSCHPSAVLAQPRCLAPALGSMRMNASPTSLHLPPSASAWAHCFCSLISRPPGAASWDPATPSCSRGEFSWWDTEPAVPGCVPFCFPLPEAYSFTNFRNIFIGCFQPHHFELWEEFIKQENDQICFVAQERMEDIFPHISFQMAEAESFSFCSTTGNAVSIHQAGLCS